MIMYYFVVQITRLNDSAALYLDQNLNNRLTACSQVEFKGCQS